MLFAELVPDFDLLPTFSGCDKLLVTLLTDLHLHRLAVLHP